MAEKVVSRRMSIVLEISMYVIYFGALTAYVIISSSSVRSFIKNIFDYDANSYLVKAIISVCFIFPLCLLKNLKQLGQIAGVAGLSIFVTAVTIVVYFFVHVGSQELCTKADG